MGTHRVKFYRFFRNSKMDCGSMSPECSLVSNSLKSKVPFPIRR
nr:MAG TPA: hypothetical protein [Caudoviricetes sp.]